MGVTGSVATVKFTELVVQLRTLGDVKVVATLHGQRMQMLAEGYSKSAWDAFSALSPPVPVLTDDDEWSSYRVVGKDPVLHIEV